MTNPLGPLMSLVGFPVCDCSNESDVEQKFLYPLLTHQQFLGIPPKHILTKRYIGTLSFVNKTALPRDYIPDYMLTYAGFPVCVIEAKSPDFSADAAISEARIYAQVLNLQFPSGTNPICTVIGTNGRELLVGPWDTNESRQFTCESLRIGSRMLDDLRRLAGTLIFSDWARRIQRSLSRSSFTAPFTELDPQIFLEIVRPNALAPYLTPLYEMFFRGEDPEKIQLILEKAYVDTTQIREYDNVLHSMLRQIERVHGEYQPIQTDSSREYTLTPELSRYQEHISTQGRLHLIIGARGAGKSLFIARFFTHLIPDRLRKAAAWCVIDFNRAPADIDNIEEYICERFVEDIQNIGFDPFTLQGINRVFSVELNRLRKGVLQLLEDPEEKRATEVKEILRLSGDKRTFALSLARHITGEGARPLIIAFDNVDRRESTQQLRIFQAAQWFRTQTRGFALLTLRDTTFDRFKDEPPLDAFAQINNFYIRPPRFSLVLQKRLRLAIDEGLKDFSEIEQPTTSGIRFRYSKDHLAEFLERVYDAIFGGGQQVVVLSTH